MTIPRAALAAGYDVPPLIIGGWQLAEGHSAHPTDRDTLFRQWDMLAEHGLDTFDCADIYTGVESLLGAYRRARPGRRIQVHTKFVPDRDALATLDRRYVERIVHRSRERLGVEALDLVQLHWWDYAAPGIVEAAHELDRLRRAGLIRHVGVTNTNAAHVQAIVAAGVPLVSNQVQYSLLDRRPRGSFSDAMRDAGAALLCYGSVAGGFLADRWLGAPEPAGDMENRSLVKYRLVIEEGGGWPAFQRLLQSLDAIARRQRVLVANVAQRWVLEQPGVSAAIIGMRSAESAAGTLRTLNLTLDDGDRAAIATALAQLAGPSGDVYALERDRDGRHAAIMRYDLQARQG